MLIFRASSLTKTFDRKIIFQNISFQLKSGDSLAITGRNGTGKSTLIKLLSNTLSPSSGELELQTDNSKIRKEELYKYIGVVSPYLYFYEEFTAFECLMLAARIRGIALTDINGMLEKVGLYSRKNDLVRVFSSGMKQRLKFAFALIHNPPVLLLDEPTSNLDKEGIGIVSGIINTHSENGIIVIATNSEFEKSLCKKEINLNSRSDV